METVSQLKKLGFSQYEAQAYVALLQKNPLNGYELAKESGIPRPNVYGVLQKLEDAGAVMRLSTPEGTRYVPVPAGELLEKLHRRYQQALDNLSRDLQKVAPPPDLEAILNLNGYEEMIDQARSLVDRTERRLLISTWVEEAQALSEVLQQASERGVQITTLCLRGCPQPCPACRGTVYRYAIAPVNDTRWLLLVSDAEELLAGEIYPGSNGTASMPASASAARTRQQMLVRLAGSYIQNSIALASIMTGLGDRLVTELDPETAAALNEMHALHTEDAWLDTMKQMLHPQERKS